MEKTEMMIEYESRTGLRSTRVVGDHWCNEDAHTESYVDDLEERFTQAQAKAEAYDRLMNMNSISENDIQIVLDGNAWCAYRLPFRNLQEDNAGFGVTPQMALTSLLESESPDEWEES